MLKNWRVSILGIAIVASLTALIAQYIFNVSPCKFCIYQRYPYYALILLSAIFLLLKINQNKLFYILIELVLIGGIIVTIWHLGIENNLIKGPEGCSNSFDNILSVESLKSKIPSDQPNKSFLGPF